MKITELSLTELITLFNYYTYIVKSSNLLKNVNEDELSNFIKKYKRESDNFDFKIEMSKELGDIQIYLSLLSESVGINLSAATQAKFNNLSDKYQLNIKI